MATGVQVWSTTAASNNTADSNINWSEGMAPSAVNDSARAEMASVAKWRDDNSGTIATTGTTAAYTITTTQVSTSNTDGYTVAIKFHATNDSSATLARDTAPAANMQLVAGTNLSGGEFLAGTIHKFTYISGSTAWVAQGANLLGTSAVATGNIAANAVTYAKMQTVTDQRLLGNFSGGAAVPSEYSVVGPAVSGSALSFPFPPTSSFKNLSIKVASTTTVTGAADFATLASTSSAYLTLPMSGTVNLGTNGAVNTLDTGTVASGTWYAVWGIAQSTSTAGGFLASTSYTTPLMPSGYTYKAYLGSIVTSTSTASAQLMGTWQLGRRAQYVVGLAQTAAPPVITSGSVGTYSASSPTLSSATVTGNGYAAPTTASELLITATVNYKGGTAASVIVAPSSAYSGTNNGPTGSDGTVPPVWLPNTIGPQTTASILLESSAIYIASDNTGGAVLCTGWIDNI